MNGPCAKCGVHLESPWKFCPQCGAEAAHEPQAAAKPAEHEKASVKAAFGGLFLGMIVVPVLLIVGTMLCLTGLGAFLGVPMIIAGILSPLAGPMLGITEVRGKCPWCGVPVNSIAQIDAFVCHSCSKRIAVKSRTLVRAT
ncbi:MAG: hypothetical protein WBE72_00625 [Terracidiphilus sp.]